jgi:hypothetical protein
LGLFHDEHDEELQRLYILAIADLLSVAVLKNQHWY